MFQSLFGFKKHVDVPQISAQELYKRRGGNEPLVLIDVRTPREYEFDGHITGARLLPLSSLHQRLEELPKDQTIVCICRSGARSQSACEMLANAGFTNVVNLRGGMMDWKRNGLPFNQS